KSGSGKVAPGEPVTHSALPNPATEASGADDSLSRVGNWVPMTSTPLRLIDATRDPSINDAFRQALDRHAAVEVRIEMADVDFRCFQLNVTPLTRSLAVGVFFDISDLERLERIRREFLDRKSTRLNSSH